MVRVGTSTDRLMKVYPALAAGLIWRDLWTPFWWRFMPGQEVSLPWPREDPSRVYRPWLIEHVGRQGWDWEWQWYGHMRGGRYGAEEVFDEVVIKIRRGRAYWIPFMRLKFL